MPQGQMQEQSLVSWFLGSRETNLFIAAISRNCSGNQPDIRFSTVRENKRRTKCTLATWQLERCSVMNTAAY